MGPGGCRGAGVPLTLLGEAPRLPEGSHGRGYATLWALAPRGPPRPPPLPAPPCLRSSWSSATPSPRAGASLLLPPPHARGSARALRLWTEPRPGAALCSDRPMAENTPWAASAALYTHAIHFAYIRVGWGLAVCVLSCCLGPLGGLDWGGIVVYWHSGPITRPVAGRQPALPLPFLVRW